VAFGIGAALLLAFTVAVGYVIKRIGTNIQQRKDCSIREKQALKILGFMLALLSRGPLLILLDLFLSPIQCRLYMAKGISCNLGVSGHWSLLLIGSICAFFLLTIYISYTVFSSRDCFNGSNNLSTASATCEIIHFFTKMVCFTVTLMSLHIGRVSLGSV
jgi:hypothetical protein